MMKTKKILMALIAVLMVAVLCIPALAKLPTRDETDVVELYACDSPFGSFTTDKNEKTEGSASMSVTLSGEHFVAEKKLSDEFDITDCDSIAIDLYVSDLDKIAGVTTIFFEISSSGQCDKEEFQWEFASLLRDDRLEEGWNTVYLDIGSASQADICDKEAINYMRFYTFQTAQASGLTLKLDNIRACYTGGDDYSDLSLDFYKGDNGDKDVVIQGQAAPDLTHRDDGITQAAGAKK